MLFIRVFRVALYPRPEGRGFTASLIKYECKLTNS
jgi:hypothetical protein